MRGRDRNKYESFGDVFFITSTIVGFIKLFERKHICHIIIENLRFYQTRGDFIILAYVIMPNHLHFVLKTNKQKSISKIMANFKRITSRQISDLLKKSGECCILKTLSQAASLESEPSKIWKPRFDSLVITNMDTLCQKIEYIHNNPVKKRLTVKPEDWPYSSARNYTGLGNVLLDVDTNWNCLS
jgi:REP element-mobilizing transposase RayT